MRRECGREVPVLAPASRASPNELMHFGGLSLIRRTKKTKKKLEEIASFMSWCSDAEWGSLRVVCCRGKGWLMVVSCGGQGG